MYKLEKGIKNYRKPEYGLKYEHLTQEEVLYITNSNNCNSKTRLLKMKEFVSAHKNLEKFEERIKDCTALDIRRDYPFWYICHLASYGRICVTYEVMIRIISCNYKELCYENSPFINIKFLEQFKKESERLGYCDTTTNRNLRELIAISIFFKVETQEIPKMFDKYIKFCNDNNIYDHSIVPSIYGVITSMGYNLLEVGIILNSPAKRQHISKNMSQEFLDSLEEYIEWYSKKVSKKTIKYARSHLMVFFNYIADISPDIKELCLIGNEHIVSFIKFQLESKNIFGRINSAGTINARIEVISKAWAFFTKKNKYEITSNIVTPYDKVKEQKKFPVYISKENILKLINALNNVDNEKFMELKHIITILLSTGRRIHEVLSLQYDCLNPINGRKYIYFHKIKQGKPPKNVPINKNCEIAVLKLQEMAVNFRGALKSRHDELIVRRLFPSKKCKGRYIISENTVGELFDEFQALNNIVTADGKAIFDIHDIKRIFVSNMLALGYSAVQISKFLMQGLDTLLPYESNNETALKTLKSAEEKGLLVGNEFVNEYDAGQQDDTQFKRRIIELLKNTDISNRHTENLAYKLKNPQEEVPLYFGVCTDKDSISVCGTLICIACDDVLLDSIANCEEFFVKMYKYIYRNKRNKEIKAVEQQLKIACENIYIKKEKMSETEMKKRINFIKKQAREYVRDEMV